MHESTIEMAPACRNVSNIRLVLIDEDLCCASWCHLWTKMVSTRTKLSNVRFVLVVEDEYWCSVIEMEIDCTTVPNITLVLTDEGGMDELSTEIASALTTASTIRLISDWLRMDE